MERKEKNITSVSSSQQTPQHSGSANVGSPVKFRDFSKELIVQIYKQAKPNGGQIQKAASFGLHDQQQPCSSNQKFKAARVYREQGSGKVQNRKTFNKKARNPHRMSFESRLQDKREKLESSGIMKFPSQKTLLSKQKVLPVSSHEREKYVIQIYRIMKENQSTAIAQNSKQLQAFREHQKQKYMKCIEQKKKKKDEAPVIAINYDGSIMNVQPLKKTLNQFIECTGEIIADHKIELMNDKTKQRKKMSEGKFQKSYDKIEEMESQYIDNFSRINWSPKITVYNSSKLKQGNKQYRPSRKTSTMQQQLKQKKQSYHHNRSRAHTVSITKASNDDKSIIKIMNTNAFEEHLMTKPTHVNGKRSYTSSQITEDIKLIMDENANREQSQIVRYRPGTAGCFNRSNKNINKLNNCVQNKQKIDLADEDSATNQKNHNHSRSNLSKGVIERCKSAHCNSNHKKPQNDQHFQIKISSPTYLAPSSINTSLSYANKENNKPGRQFLKKFQSQKNSMLGQVKKKTKIRENIKQV